MQNRFFNLLAMIGGCLFAGTANAQSPIEPVHNATLEFSLQQNPNDVWSYREVKLDGIHLMKVANSTLHNITGLEAWTNGKEDAKQAYIATNTTNADVNLGEVTYPKGELVLKAYDAGSAVVDFKAKVHGLYRVSGFFRGVDKKEEYHTLQIANRKTVYYRRIMTEYGEVTKFHFYLTMKSSDILEFESTSSRSENPQRGATGLKLLIKGPITK